MKKPDITDVVNDLNNVAGKILLHTTKLFSLAYHKHKRSFGILHKSKASICWQQNTSRFLPANPP